jgi:hypothetical protein
MMNVIDLEGSGHDGIKLLSWRLSGGTERNHEEHQSG